MLGSLALVLCYSTVAFPQSTTRPRLIAMVLAFSDGDPEGQAFSIAFREQMQRAGWTIGKDLTIEVRWGATTAERAATYAAEVEKLKPDLVVAHATIVTRAMKKTLKDIPVVFTNVSDPIGEHFIESFSRPGGDYTGFTNVEPSTGGKYLELLKEMVPSLQRAIMIFNPASTPGGGSFFARSFETAGKVLSVKTVRGAVKDFDSLEGVIKSAGEESSTGLVIIGEPFTNLHRDRILQLSAAERLPALCPYRFYVQKGCLMSYGVSFRDQFQRAAGYADRILKGAKPATLPAQAPVKFDLTINLSTAKALGLNAPAKLVLMADETFE